VLFRSVAQPTPEAAEDDAVDDEAIADRDELHDAEEIGDDDGEAAPAPADDDDEPTDSDEE
jgi:hypothetical protein